MSILRLSKKRFIKFSAILIMLLLIMQIILPNLNILSTTSYAAESTTLTFSNSGIIETVSGEGYKIKQSTGLITGNPLYTLTINSAGTYRIKGSCSNGNIVVKKDVSNVVLILDNLSLTCSDTAPIVVKKSETATTSATIQLVGTSTLIDSENPSNESSTTITTDGTTYADEFEGATIKVKSGSELTIKGSGTLNAIGTSCKNGIKGGKESSITINSGNINIDAANNGLACDGTITINGGTIDIDADNEGIKLSPDDDDTTSVAELTINGGTISVDAGEDGIQAVGDININKWPVITINAGEDGIQTRSDFTMTNGTLNITTFGGYNASGFNSNTMSAKGIKASPSDDTTDDATNMIKISAGTVTLNTKDDAIHSDGYVTITGGTFNIKTGDDGVHADTSLVIGTNGGLERDPYINVNYSYEGLEAGTVYIYSGKIYIIATDDGINAAGGSSNGTDTGGGGGNHFNPGGGPGGPGSGGPRGSGTSSSSSSSYALYIYGGKVFINCSGDGLDANGSIYLYGGTQVVYSMAGGGDNSALDYDNSIVINGATIFTAGGAGMDGSISSTGSSQKFISSTTTYSANSKLAVKNGSTVVFNDTIPKKSTYTFYSSPSLSSGSITTVSSLTDKYNNAWNHNWNSGVITTEATPTSNGVMTYTCTTCGETERQTILYNASENGTEVELENKTGGLATVTIGEETSTDDITTNITEGTVTVASSKPCVVLITTDNGSSYTKLSATATNTSNTYKFTFDIEEDLELIVALKGDINLNGEINAADSVLISRSKLSSSASAYRALSTLEEVLADINNSGSVNAADAMLINRASLSSSTISYSALTW